MKVRNGEKKAKWAARGPKDRQASFSSSENTLGSASCSCDSSSSCTSYSTFSESFDERAKSGGKKYVPAHDVNNVEFKMIGGRRHFNTNAGKWVDCSMPPTRVCNRCGQRHWLFQRQEFRC